MNSMSYKIIESDQQIQLDNPPKNPKKITATRLATILGLNTWATPFEAWCAITRTYEAPFEDTIYTKAGKIIEPKVIEYLKNTMFMDIKSPTDVYGPDYFKQTWGDFFKDTPTFGGMWDALGDDFIVEIKTTKRAEDWEDGAPIYYKIQAALYAYLLGFDRFYMTVSILQDSDYQNPEAFKPSYQNTKIYEYSVSKEFPNFSLTLAEARVWWYTYVEQGISPQFDEKKDAAILKELRKHTITPDDYTVTDLLAEYDSLAADIAEVDATIEPKRQRMKEIEEQLKRYMVDQFRDGDKQVVVNGQATKWTLTRSERTTVNTDALKKAGLYDTYTQTKTTLTLKKTAI